MGRICHQCNAQSRREIRAIEAYLLRVQPVQQRTLPYQDMGRLAHRRHTDQRAYSFLLVQLLPQHQERATRRRIPAATLKYYGEYEYPSDVEVTFVARDTKTIKGIWGTGVSYTNRNDKDANGNYTPMEITEDAKDASEVQLLNSILTVPYATRQKIRYHDKYQGACRLHWNPGSL